MAQRLRRCPNVKPLLFQRTLEYCFCVIDPLEMQPYRWTNNKPHHGLSLTLLCCNPCVVYDMLEYALRQGVEYMPSFDRPLPYQDKIVLDE